MEKIKPGVSAAKLKQGNDDLDSYTIEGTNKVVQVGDCVLIRLSDTNKASSVARIEKIEYVSSNDVNVRVRWYYRPEQAIGGRRCFHGRKELFFSDHYGVLNARTIEGKCIVHSLNSYEKLDNVEFEDYYCRFEYKAATGAFTPNEVVVYCICEMPYNPDEIMVRCIGCKKWYHPTCIGMSIIEARALEHFVCFECSNDDDKRLQNEFHESPVSDIKVEPKWQKCK